VEGADGLGAALFDVPPPGVPLDELFAVRLSVTVRGTARFVTASFYFASVPFQDTPPIDG
jgi:hypothetical protein